MQGMGVLGLHRIGVFLRRVVDRGRAVPFVLATSCFLLWTAGGLAAPIDFQRQVRPALSDACFQCHGPDPATRLADLRFDTREGAFGKRPSGTPIVPGDPDGSLLYQRIINPDKARRMPPEYSHKTLTEEQISTIREWIEQGANWEEHWAFTAPTRPEPPRVENAAWVRNPIDRFVLARLKTEGLEPAPEADRRTIARRVALDVTGLPPSPEQVDQFLNDRSADAYEKFVDRLMASEAYGEHRARYWLDAARYADTHGLHHDNYREMWPYRDWVIRAFNRNQPFDDFTVEQIAGDLLPNATKEQVVATGFNRCNITTSEGGSIKEEVLVIYAKDRVDTTSTVWLGLTVGCATCHDHKFDPIAQRDFYSMAAFFRNTTQQAMDLNHYDTPPALILPPMEDETRWGALKTEEPQAREKLADARVDAQNDFDEWLRSRKTNAISVERFDGSESLSLDLGRRATVRLGAKTASLKLAKAASVKRRVLELPKEGFAEVAGFPSFSTDEPFTISVLVQLQEGEKSRVIAAQTDPRKEDRGWKLVLSEGLPSLELIAKDRHTIGRKATGDRKVEVGKWHHVVATYDGKRQRSGITIFLDGKPLPAENFGRELPTLRGSIETDAPLILGASENEDGDKSGFLNGAIRDFRLFRRALTEPEAALLARWDVLTSARKKKAGRLSDGERQALELYYLVRRHEPYQAAAKGLAALRDERRAILHRSAVTHVMKEKEDSDPMAHVLYRGMYDQRRDEVGPATPGVLPPMPDTFPRNRLGLAKWLVSDSNPLPARVTVNRFWQEVFGTGLVKTAEDFGSQGEAPSHPELLDWLAVEFRESGWDMKHMFRLILTSAAYRQSAVVTDVKRERDAENRLLSRGPRFRMDGEMIRDYALVTSGLLAKRIGGQSVKPYHPEGVWEAVAMNGSNTRFYKQDEGESLYRRSMYTFWKRAAPPPSMVTFNAPTREFCSVRRERTNTPLQALLTLNGTQFFEAARHLAADAVRASKHLDRQLDYMSERLLVRGLSEKEREIARSAYKDYLHYYDANPDAAGKALSVGDSEPDAGLPKAESAALTMLANQLMNLDEVLNK
jgi:hypothetical protein